MRDAVKRSRAGKLKTNLSGEATYESFAPTRLPPKPSIEFDDEIAELLVKATRQLTLLEAAAARIPNVNLFISMYVRKEALMSSQIEGTQATLEDVLDPLIDENLIDENVNRNVADVINYIKATEFAVRRLSELPLCNRFGVLRTQKYLFRQAAKNAAERFLTASIWKF
jgi:Fic family protein